ncbi:alpha-N-acetylglucosaminidase isoform X1 [Anthonomus grandis grandis]|uniref:alpha-N-acetylglucosaminidase isoform X1 n=2 Tax=Anthonomus grandis grandis TaxID=2921223 RepID=UPI0021655E5C|nr:alpha-N-acetylglucosaminidase isoform X1 [Anthonomus grandis grandis]
MIRKQSIIDSSLLPPLNWTRIGDDMKYSGFLSLLACSTILVKADNIQTFQTTLGHIKTKTSDNVQQRAVENLIGRILPNRTSEFSIVVKSNFSVDGREAFKITKVHDKIEITGTTGVAASTGFHYYLKYYCNAHISWEVSQLNLPESLPKADVTIILNDRFRYYQNVCTTSYSFVWWDWSQWEKHIDWMALNSFNFVLAFNGQEAIWDRVYKKLNLSDADIDEHFSGPTFLSWLRMGNLRGWGGPLSQSWHDRSLYLQHKILDRMREFGIIPILPAFAGHVPRAFERIFPDTNMTKMAKWNNFPDKYCCPLFIDPTEPLFQTVGKLFIQEQIAEYGTDHVYNCDSFNEMQPGSSDLTYLSNVGKSIYGAMTSADPDAIWVLQGWLFYNDPFWTNSSRAKSFLTSVPTGKMIVLDLQSEEFPQFTRLEQYFGQPYIWCMLHNFGGTIAMYGSAGIINTEVLKARSSVNSTMIGTGLTMEGINQNYVIYDLMTEQAWRNESIDLSEWFKNYSRRRYGKEDQNAQKAWEGFYVTLYNFSGTERMRGQFAITRTPGLDIYTWSWYKYSDFFDSWKLFLKAANNLKDSPGYLHDLVDLTRQVLQDNGDIYYNRLVTAFKDKNITEFQKVATIFRGIFLDLESILATNEDFLLGRWLDAAKKCANGSSEEKLFEYDARNQITLWGPYGEIINYAIKQWSGMVKDFLYPRWDEFIFAMNLSLVYKVEFDETLEKNLIFVLYEEPFVFSRKNYTIEPEGDTISIAQAIANRDWYTDVQYVPKLKVIPVRNRRVYKQSEKFNEYTDEEMLKMRRQLSRIRNIDKLRKYFYS